jgi:hypothetical protein
MTHPTEDSKRVAKMILKGRYQNLFWMGTIVMGNLLPLLVIFIGGNFAGATASILLLAGIYTTEKIWVEAPQRIPLT